MKNYTVFHSNLGLFKTSSSDLPPYFVPLRELVSDLPSADLLCIQPYSIIPDCPIPSEAEHEAEQNNHSDKKI